MLIEKELGVMDFGFDTGKISACLRMFEHFSIWEQHQETGTGFIVSFLLESVLDIFVIFSSARNIQSILPKTLKISIRISFVSVVLYNGQKRSLFWLKESFCKCFKTVCSRDYSRTTVIRTHVNSISQESELTYTPIHTHSI